MNEKKIKKSMFFIHLQILFEKWNRCQMWCFSNFLQNNMWKLAVLCRIWLVTFAKAFVSLFLKGKKTENFILSINNVFAKLLNSPYFVWLCSRNSNGYQLAIIGHFKFGKTPNTWNFKSEKHQTPPGVIPPLILRVKFFMNFTLFLRFS